MKTTNQEAEAEARKTSLRFKDTAVLLYRSGLDNYIVSCCEVERAMLVSKFINGFCAYRHDFPSILQSAEDERRIGGGK